MYELLLVTTVDKGDQLLGRVEKLIKAADAKDYKLERLGKKPLAYQIRKQADANFYILNFDVEGTQVGPITEKLRLEQEDLLRYLLLVKKAMKPGQKSKKVEKPELQAKDEEKEAEKPKVTVAVKTTSAAKAKPKSAAKSAQRSKVAKPKASKKKK